MSVGGMMEEEKSTGLTHSYGDRTLRPDEIEGDRMEFTDNVTLFFLPGGARGTTEE